MMDPLLIIILIVLFIHFPKNNTKTVLVTDMKNITEKRLEDALLPPERTQPSRIPINIRTQGALPDYQQVGFIYQESSGIRLPLFGRPEYYGSDKWEYYVKDDSRNMVKIPLDNTKELYTGDIITVSGFQGDFVGEIYELDQPRYIPYI